MRCAHEGIFQKALPLKLTKTLNASIFVSSVLNFVCLGVLHILFTTMVYVQGAEWKKLIEWNEYQENTIDKYDFPCQSPKLSRESYFALSLNYAGLCKGRSSKQVTTDNFQRRALLRKIVETLKKSIISFTIANLVSKSILYFLITTYA